MQSSPQKIDWQAELARHKSWLRATLFARLGESEAVDEVMQEISLAVVRQSSVPDDPEKVAPWLYQVAVRQALLYRRKIGRRKKLKNRYVEKFQPTERDQREPDPLAWLLDRERQGMVRKAIGQLPSRDAEILMLKYAEDWSYQQISEKLGVSHSAVEARLHRARGRLRKLLADLEVAP